MDVVGLLILLGLGLAIGWVLLVGYTAWMLTHPPRRSYAWAVARSLPGSPDELRRPGAPVESEAARIRFAEWTFRSRGRELPVWEIEGDRADGPVMIITHGWADSRTVMLASGRVPALMPMVSKLVLWDMPGHGDAPGVCSLGGGETRDLAELVERVAGGESARRVVLVGFSLGAAVTLRAYSRQLVPRVASCALVLEAPYIAPEVPARNVLRMRGLPWRSNLWAGLTLAGLISGHGLAGRPRRAWTRPPFPWLMGPTLDVPTLIVQGTQDTVTPVDDSRAIAAAMPRARLVLIEGGRHTTLWNDPATAPATTSAVQEFLASLT